jgi:hypothetical protein
MDTNKEAKQDEAPKRATNRDVARCDGAFRAACVMAHIKPTVRQASKYRRGVGAARLGVMVPHGGQRCGFEVQA